MSHSVTFTVIKCNHLGEEVWRYPAIFLQQIDHGVVIEAIFNRPDIPINGILLRKGDKFIETYYDDRWYNIFEIHDKDDDSITGWYCNVTRPAIIGINTIIYHDLALDVLIYPDRSYKVLDEDEFYALNLDGSSQQSCWQTVAKLIEISKTIQPYQT